MKLVGITGRAQHGKNTTAEAFEQFGYAPVAFADQLRALLLKVNPYVFCDYPQRYKSLLQERGYEDAKKVPEVRRLLQELGVGVREVIGEDAWVNALLHSLDPNGRYVITDVRFPNEAAAVYASGGQVWRVTRPGFDNGLGTDHPSEQYVDSLAVDLSLFNDKDAPALHTLAMATIISRGLNA